MSRSLLKRLVSLLGGRQLPRTQRSSVGSCPSKARISALAKPPPPGLSEDQECKVGDDCPRKHAALPFIKEADTDKMLNHLADKKI